MAHWTDMSSSVTCQNTVRTRTRFSHSTAKAPSTMMLTDRSFWPCATWVGVCINWNWIKERSRLEYINLYEGGWRAETKGKFSTYSKRRKIGRGYTKLRTLHEPIARTYTLVPTVPEMLTLRRKCLFVVTKFSTPACCSEREGTSESMKCTTAHAE